MVAIKGRGAPSNHTPARFALPQRQADGDWLDCAEGIDGLAPPVRTTVTELAARTIISTNTSPDIPFDRSLNAYGGCEHGCIYCYARPTHAWHDLSPGLDFETRLFAKPQAAALLRRAWARASYQPAPLALGPNNDPYQPIERHYRLTRQVLELALECGHPLTITTKSARILDDADLIAELARRDLVAVTISVTTLDARLSAKLEPRASTPDLRLAALARLAALGVPCTAGIAPIIPAITDQWLEGIVARAGVAGVSAVSWIMLRLPHEVAPLFREWLDVHFPDRAGKVMAIIRDMRNGADNDPRFHTRMKPQGPWPDLVRSRLRLAVRRAGIPMRRPALDCSRFARPAPDGQLRLL